MESRSLKVHHGVSEARRGLFVQWGVEFGSELGEGCHLTDWAALLSVM